MTSKSDIVSFINDIGDLGEKSDIKALSVDINQIRLSDKFIDDTEIVSLADSIKKHGLINPIIVRLIRDNSKSSSIQSDFVKKLTEEDTYEVIIGERRLRAMKLIGKETIPCIICDADDKKSKEMLLIDSLSRKEPNMFEYAETLWELINTYSLRQEEAAIRLSTSQPNIANKLRLLRYTGEERSIILKNSLTERHARELLRIKDEKRRKEALCEVANSKMSIRETENLVEDIVNSENGVINIVSRIDRIYSDALSAANLYSSAGKGASVTKYENEREIRITIKIEK